MTTLWRLADRMLNRPLLVHPDKAPLILAALDGRLPVAVESRMVEAAEAHVAELPPEAQRSMTRPAASRYIGERYDPDTGEALPYRRTPAGVAVVSVIGGLVNRGSFLDAKSGLSSYEMIGYQLAQAEADPGTRAIVLDIDSPGGEAVGAFELADQLRAIGKPTLAVVNGMAASAAYALASAADRIVIGPSGVAGSIGVVMLHVDLSRNLDRDGITPTLLHRGAHKVDGNPFEPLSEDVRAALEADMDVFYDLFVDGAAAGRPLSPAQVRDTEARVYIGQAAVAAGLADDVGTFAAAVARLEERLAPSTVMLRKGHQMTKQTEAPAAQAGETTVDTASAERDIVAARDEGFAAGEQAERARVTAILGMAPAGQGETAAQMIAEGTPRSEAAERFLAAANEAVAAQGGNVEALNQMAAAEAATGDVPAAAGPVAKPKAKSPSAMSDDELRAAYADDPALQAEFAAADDYVAFTRAEARGQVRILKGRERAA